MHAYKSHTLLLETPKNESISQLFHWKWVLCFSFPWGCTPTAVLLRPVWEDFCFSSCFLLDSCFLTVISCRKNAANGKTKTKQNTTKTSQELHNYSLDKKVNDFIKWRAWNVTIGSLGYEYEIYGGYKLVTHVRHVITECMAVDTTLVVWSPPVICSGLAVAISSSPWSSLYHRPQASALQPGICICPVKAGATWGRLRLEHVQNRKVKVS